MWVEVNLKLWVLVVSAPIAMSLTPGKSKKRLTHGLVRVHRGVLGPLSPATRRDVKATERVSL